jgi:3-oxoacyl-[acyl-carrier protein] reductase
MNREFHFQPRQTTSVDETAAANRVVLVTGASRGIGAATALRLGRDGLAVALNSYPDSIRVSEAERIARAVVDAGGIAEVFVADISAEDSVHAMFEAVEVRLGRVNSIVLNAAATQRHPWAEATQADWDRIMSVNLRGAYFCVRRAFAHVVPPSAAVVAIGSVQAMSGAPDALAYSTSKSGLIGFTRALAKALGPEGARVNCVLPGAIQTEEESESFPDVDAITRALVQSQAIRRRGLPDDIASAVSFLVSGESSFITGQTLRVDGGWMPS